MHDESAYAERALRAGANGYIMKQEATEKVLTAIRQILRGDVYLSDRLTKRMLQQFVHGSISPRDPLAKLERPGTRSLPVDRRRPWNAPDCR